MKLQIKPLRLTGGKRMNKSQLIEAIAAGSGLSKKDSEAALKATLDSIEGALTNETIKIPASTVPTFKAGKSFKDSVNKKKGKKK